MFHSPFSNFVRPSSSLRSITPTRASQSIQDVRFDITESGIKGLKGLINQLAKVSRNILSALPSLGSQFVLGNSPALKGQWPRS